MDMGKPQLLVAGSIAVDRIMSFSSRYQDLIKPEHLEVLSLSVLVDTMTEARGGIGPNIAFALAALGEKPTLLGSAGHDSTDYLAQLKSLGINTDHVHISELPTASFTAFTDADNNQVAGFYPGAMGDSESVSLGIWSGADALVCLSAHDPAAMRRQVQECVEHGIRLFYDPGQQVSNVPAEDLAAGVAAAELLAVNEYEQNILCEKLGISLDELAGRVGLLVTTRGENGSLITGTSMPHSIHIPIATPAKIVDPTGAGDGYRAGFLYGYVRQWDVKVCAQLGSVVASFILEQAGTQVPLAIDAIKQRYQETYKEEVNL
jgi:adenosine kinase